MPIFVASALHIAAVSASALVALGVGAAGGLAFRWSERDRAKSDPSPEPLVPSGVAAVLQVLRSSAVLLDPSDAVVKASPAAHAMGLVRGQRLVPEELTGIARQVRRDGEIRQVELELPRGPLGQDTLAVSVRVAPLGSQLVLVLVEDRTEARRVDAVRRDFVANVSHELKTPVGALALLAEAVLSASDDPDAVRRFAGRMQKESHRLTNLVQDLIDLSRVQGDDPLAKAVPVDLGEVVSAARERVAEVAEARSIEIVAAGADGVAVLGDRGQLTTAVGNLVENAVNYSPDRTKVVVSVRVEGELAEVSVTDQGVGIPDQDLNRIFERFYRVDPARSRITGGTGLGLAIVKHIAATHGGDVSVWSVEGAGSTFTLRLPVAVQAPAAELHPTTPAQQAITTGSRTT
ncbi:two-component sensor histidine kinase [Actinospica sp. MGRD01-02]|uniref:Sensor-like histidine kinase SenX3 n=1 Tax=Actinospica acidithermotolerans TaxID=2828514 RepID=A0A941II85_9ACTN|nr:ATP-binding protein [Actinospica acidithermotolerans]MBR7825898.1 two-component sensor histidine kinase [Actinospica acidithermotolerans]